MNLPAPARYFPFEKGHYEIAPALKSFGTSFGNGAEDSKVFQFDTRFAEFRQSKLDCRKDRLSKYYLEKDYSPYVAAGIARLIISRLTTESPEFFSAEPQPDGSLALACQLTGEQLRFDPEMRLIGAHGSSVPQYESALDALALQVQEDLNVLTVEPDGRNWLSAMHVSSPSSWRPEEKIGLDFVGIHAPVPQNDALVKASRGIVGAMVNKGPYVRFNWGLTTQTRPNHHPDLPRQPGPHSHLWVERQVVWGAPEVGASLFTIRISFQSLDEIRADPARSAQILATLRSMTPEIRDYKGLAESFDDLAGFFEPS